MAGVEAHADPRRAVEMLDDRAQAARSDSRASAPVPPCARRAPSSCGAAAHLNAVADRVGDQRSASSSVPAVHVPGWMTTPSSPSACARSSSSTKASIDSRAQRGIGGGEIDQVAGVRHGRRDAGLVEPPAEAPDLRGIERLAPPLVGVLGEDLQRFAAMHDGAIDGFRDAAGDGHMRAD